MGSYYCDFVIWHPQASGFDITMLVLRLCHMLSPQFACMLQTTNRPRQQQQRDWTGVESQWATKGSQHEIFVTFGRCQRLQPASVCRESKTRQQFDETVIIQSEIKERQTEMATVRGRGQFKDPS